MPKIVVIGGSAGSIDALKHILGALPRDFPAPILIVVHIGARESLLPSLLERSSSLPVQHAHQGGLILAGQVLVAPPDLHLTVARDGERSYAHLSRAAKENHSRPAIDPLFRSAAVAYGADAIGVVLSGFLDDGTVGLQAIKARGGLAVVQDPRDAEASDMPASALEHTAADFVGSVEQIAAALVELVNRPRPARERESSEEAGEPSDWITVENQMFGQISAMKELDRIGSRSSLTCPECGGAIWEIGGKGPLRYRCHTGHAFTGRILETLQRGETEEALWAAVRALHEQEQLYLQLHRKPLANPEAGADAGRRRDEYLMKAAQARENAQLLCDLITTRASAAQS